MTQEIPSVLSLSDSDTRALSPGSILARRNQDLLHFVLVNLMVVNMRVSRFRIGVEADAHRHYRT